MGGTPSSTRGLSNDPVLSYSICLYGISNPQKGLSTHTPPPPFPPPTTWGSSEPSLHASNMGLLLDEALVPFHIQLLRGFKPSKRFIHPTQLEAPVSPAFFSVIPWLLSDQLHSLYVRRFRPSFFDVTIILHLRASWLAVIWFWKPYVVTKNNKDIICSRS